MNRVIPGLALALCWLFLLLQCSVAFFAVILFIGLAIGAYEYGKMVLAHESFLEPAILAFLAILPVLSSFFIPFLGVSGGLTLAFLLLSFWTLATYKQGLNSLHFFSECSLCLLWVGFLGAHLLLIRTLPEGHYWLLILTGITAGSDSGAYYTGRAFGKNKLSPLISPNKTIEGALGGIMTGMVVASLLAVLLLQTVPWIFLLFSAFVLGVVGICGDLVESVIKRTTGTKDSGTILGGHGGILDRADSMLFAAPVLYYLLLAAS
ncbi:MAG: phosphatidate cytidylyltransferase [Desulfocapsa sp.]|uniref:Phosphatidate cytidylyltransferase n=1 Tax=Desulfotalea psychrophila TaxID=84980 RepID=A0ABS3AW35_9BACT|nr:phosphatidate cytidylyltransferase [Desulfocapsa sp.]MBN4068760.1 phosphatidate cytidylyltransferase [Desulfotalea psychrophila]